MKGTLLELLRRLGFTFYTHSARLKPEIGCEQELFDIGLGVRRWTVSITSKRHPDDPSLEPEVYLIATVSNRPAS